MTRWAKAPAHHDPAATTADARRFLDDGLTPVRCGGCPSEVLVRKSSHRQTSVQWHAPPAASCPEFAERVAAGELSARIDTCGQLRAAIEHAVATGALPVPGGGDAGDGGPGGGPGGGHG
ncbi:hypothetical protein BLA60_10500 [Actinophytocola xinjiangensis]|uniref:Uncharacterized protein n=1 Tax=Actinophytocola xinjiangensis TaxID=485602 RepID=A0A7Z0WNP4_9PSEU|nr:hypothetical protein [Actinophytocola xinjiangensis]OLF11404.1 hypothetical protein BLA60_10500 [Actinophytocola xinjiangensis]